MLENEFQQVMQWCQQQMEQQIEAYNSNQQQMQELMGQQNQNGENQLSAEEQEKLQYLVNMEQTIQMNMQQIQNYNFEQQQQYQQKKTQAQVEAQGREQMH